MKKSLSKIGSVFIAALLLTVSCTTDGDSTNNNTVAIQKADTSLKLKPVKNINDFADNHVLITREISGLLYNSKIVLDSNFESKLSTAKSEDELKSMLKGYGMTDVDSDEFVRYLHLVNNNYGELITNSPKFAASSQSTQQSLVEGAISGSYDVLPVIEYPTPGEPVDPNHPNARTCREQYNLELHRCARNEALAIGISVVSGWLSGGATAVVGYAGAALYYKFCSEDARDDYHNCLDS